jgi:uncharacterized membrane protein YebE (DUF533 family)
MRSTPNLLGALVEHGMTDSTKSRVEHSLGDEGIGGMGGILEQLGLTPAKVPVGAQSRSESTSAGPTDLLGKLGGILSGTDHGKSLAAGGLGALAGAILGGGGSSLKGAIGGGALALLGSIALKALRSSQQKGQPEIDSSAQLAAGLREPENPREEKQVEAVVDLTVKAMINAAKADGRLDEDEFQKVVGELQEDGISEAEREYLLAEVRKPMCTAEIVRAVPNRQVAAQIYAASLLAIEADTPAEKEYLQQLSRDLNLDGQVVNQIHAALGVAA